MSLKSRIKRLEGGYEKDGFNDFIRRIVMSAQGTSLPISDDESDYDPQTEDLTTDGPTIEELIENVRREFYAKA